MVKPLAPSFPELLQGVFIKSGKSSEFKGRLKMADPQAGMNL